MNFTEYKNIILNEGSTEDAIGTLDAIVKFLDKQDSLDDNGKDMLAMAKDIKKYYVNKKSISPDQAKWIFNTSKALFNK